MTSAFEPAVTDARAALNAARFVVNPMSTTPAPDVWASAQRVLRAVTQRPELSGQALIGEARRLGALTLTDAHALIALLAWADASTGAAESDAHRKVLHEAAGALEHAVHVSAALDANPPSRILSVPDQAHVSATVSATVSAPVSAPVSASPFSGPDRPASTTPPAADGYVIVVPASRWGWIAPVRVVGALVGTVVIGAGVWYMLQQRAVRAYQDGVAAYQRGATAAARAAFVRAARQQPNDARPLVFLGRMSRDDGDLQRARRLLTTAVRVAPTSGLATRELASVMLADGQPEVARRFYVRALQLDPEDRVAQGFLGCALFRLNRTDEARRWTDRAGPGDWSACVAAQPPRTLPTVPPR